MWTDPVLLSGFIIGGVIAAIIGWIAWTVIDYLIDNYYDWSQRIIDGYQYSETNPGLCHSLCYIFAYNLNLCARIIFKILLLIAFVYTVGRITDALFKKRDK